PRGSSLFPYTTLFRSKDVVCLANGAQERHGFRRRGVARSQHLHARPYALEAVDDDGLARLESRLYDPQPIDRRAERDRAILDGRSEEHTSELQSRSDL